MSRRCQPPKYTDRVADPFAEVQWTHIAHLFPVPAAQADRLRRIYSIDLPYRIAGNLTRRGLVHLVEVRIRLRCPDLFLVRLRQPNREHQLEYLRVRLMLCLVQMDRALRPRMRLRRRHLDREHLWRRPCAPSYSPKPPVPGSGQYTSNMQPEPGVFTESPREPM